MQTPGGLNYEFIKGNFSRLNRGDLYFFQNIDVLKHQLLVSDKSAKRVFTNKLSAMKEKLFRNSVLDGEEVLSNVWIVRG